LLDISIEERAAENARLADQLQAEGLACRDKEAIDGDGKADCVLVNDDSIWVRRSTEHDFGPGVQANESWTHNPYYGNKGTMFADTTGDRKADAMVVNG